MVSFSRLLRRLLLLGLALGLASGVPRTQGRAGTGRTAGAELVEVESLTSVERRRQAAADLTADAARLLQAGDLASSARTLNRLAEVHLKLSDKDAALSAAREALTLSRRAGDAALLADTLIISGVVYRSRNDNDEALRLLNEAHGLSLSLKYRRGEAQSLTELGTTYFDQSELEKAMTYGERALSIWRELQDRPGEAHTLSTLGAPYMLQGKITEAADVLESAASLWRELGNLTEQASALLDLNFLAIREGQWGRALTLLNEIQTLVPDKEAEPFLSGQIATSFGEVYEAYGQLEVARSYFSQAVTLYRDFARDEVAAIDAGSKAGRVQARLGDYQGAVRQLEEGLRLAQNFKHRFSVALCHEDLGRVHLAAGFQAQAEQEFRQAAAGYKQSGNRRRELARTQAFLAKTAYMQGDLVAASKFYRDALQVFREMEDYTNEAAVCFGLGKLELERQNLEEAGQYLKRSIALTEQLRENAASKDLRSSFLSSVHERYDTYVEWLMQLHAARPAEGFDVAAFEASEMSRARSLLDSLRNYQRELRQAADPALLIEEEALQKKEQKLLDAQAKLKSEGNTGEEIAQVEDQLMKVRTRYETLEAQISSTARYNDLLRPAPLTFEEIKSQITDAETSLLEFSLGDRKSYLWVVTTEGLRSYELPDRQSIEEVGRRLTNLLSAPHHEPEEDAEIQAVAVELSRMVLGPLAGQLHSHRLVIVTDGILQYIPFQLLTDPSEPGAPLLARHEIVNVPSASTLVLLRRETARRPIAPKLLAAFGAPVFSSNYATKAPTPQQERSDATPPVEKDRPRASEGSPVDRLDPDKMQALFFVRQELNVLRKLAPANETLIYSDFDATRDHLRELDLRQYRILHFATHGLLNASQPELSGLVLSLVDRDGRPVSGFVGLSDIYHLHAPVDLVVLSACSTALGKDVHGEGLVGVTRGFMYAGASSVVASLWKVDDEATAELMKLFYANMLQQGMTPAAALREAQNSLRQQPQWSAPYYWAAFTLQGEYRQPIRSTVPGPFSGYMRVIVAAALLVSLACAAWWGWSRRGKRLARAAATIRR